MTIGDRIKKIRREFDLTQEAFASRIGSVQNTITGYESGRRNPSAPVISLICREFGINEEWLRDGIGDMLIPDPDNELEALVQKGIRKVLQDVRYTCGISREAPQIFCKRRDPR